MNDTLFLKLKSCEVRTYAGKRSATYQRSGSYCVEEIIHNLITATTVQDLHAQCVLICENYGFDFFSIVEYMVRPNRPPLLFKMLDHVSEFAIHYDKKSLMFDDPAIRLATKAIRPYIITEDLIGYEFNPRELGVIHDSLDFGLRQVFNTPFHDLPCNYGLVRFINNEGGRTSPKDRRIKFHIQAELFLLSGYIHSALTQLLSAGAFNAALSEREKQVLQWVAVGVNTARIGDLLKISENTVCNHLKNIRTKLGVKNTIHAVAKALTEGQISI